MTRRIFVTILCFLLAAPAWAQITKEEAIAEFVQGNLSYKEGDYKRAVEKYEEILKGGKASASLYFNLANAYFRDGQLGKAILNYERAKRLSPRDSDIEFNYKYVRSKANFFEGEIGNSLFQRLLQQHVHFYSVREMGFMIALIVWLMAAIHLVSLYRRWTARSRRVSLGLLTLLLCIFVGGLVIKLRAQADRAVILTRSDAKFEPREDSTTHYSLMEGAQVKVLKEDEAWFKIERPDGKQGWLPKRDLEKI